MFNAWGNIPDKAMKLAEDRYGAVVKKQLIVTLKDMYANKARYIKAAADMNIKADFAKLLIDVKAKELLDVF
jgi:hypothetical protein